MLHTINDIKLDEIILITARLCHFLLHTIAKVLEFNLQAKFELEYNYNLSTDIKLVVAIERHTQLPQKYEENNKSKVIAIYYNNDKHVQTY